MDDDDWRGKAAVDAVRTALMGWSGISRLTVGLRILGAWRRLRIRRP